MLDKKYNEVCIKDSDSFEEFSIAKSEISKRISSTGLSPVILCGSLISSFTPTSIPNGGAMSLALFNFLFNELCEHDNPLSPEDKEIIAHIYNGDDGYGNGLPFEVLFEGCGKLEQVKKILYSYFSDRIYNCIHYTLAEQLLNNNIHALITPNYDDCIDQAVKSIDASAYQSISNEEQMARFDEKLPTCFYIHGSVSNNDSPNLIVSMSDEKYLPLWKKELLSALIKDRYLIIIGYSGLDFEICPILNELIKDGTCKGIITNNNKEDYSYNVSNMLNNHSGNKEYENLSIISDILLFFNLFFNADIKTEYNSNAMEFIGKLHSVFSEKKERSLWALRLLIHMGCVKQACKVIKYLETDVKITDSEKLFLKVCEAGALYKSGKYLGSAQLYKKARKIRVYTEYQIDEMYADLALISDMFESYRAGYYLIRASICAFMMIIALRKCRTVGKGTEISAQAVVHYRKIMLYKNIAMLFNLKIPLIMNKIFSMYKKGIELAQQCGNRVLLQNFALEIMSIKALIKEEDFRYFYKTMNPSVSFAAKQTAAGYGELASFFEYAIYTRREIMNKTRVKLFEIPKANEFDDDMIKKLDSITIACEKCGIIPEAYKSLYLLAKINAACTSTSQFNWVTLFNSCQYSVLFRLRAQKYM